MPSLGLVDSGCEHLLIAPWVAQAAAVDTTTPTEEGELSIGGGRFHVKYFDLEVRLLHPAGNDEHYVQWDCEIGVVEGKWKAPWGILLGQHGFFDHFTVSMHRSAALTVIEEWGVFDGRFGISSAEPGLRPPRQPS